MSHGHSPKTGAVQPRVGIIMGSKSDWSTMTHAAEMLDGLGVSFEVKIVSAHRTPDLLFQYASTAEQRGLHVIIAGAGGAAHLPGMAAAKTLLPVLGVPVESKVLRGVDSLLSIVQMPAGIPVATFAIGRAGAINAALAAAQILARHDPTVRATLARHREDQTAKVLAESDPRAIPDPAPAARSAEGDESWGGGGKEESAPGSVTTPASSRRDGKAKVE
jgi:5-(carboxyamino)imidazole ribonucleotide mutase